MMRILHLLFYISVLVSLLSCNGEAPPRATDSPAMTRETPSPLATSNESPAAHSGSGGSFENLISDYESKDRVIWQKPNMVISMLGDLRGKTVVDIGAGSGYFTFRMVPLAEKVIGVDIDPRSIAFMDSIKVRLPEQYRSRFESRLAHPDDPSLQPEEADAVIIVNTYGYIENRVTYLRTLAKGMKTNADLLIIDFKKNSLPIGPDDAYKVAVGQVEDELLAAGFLVSTIDNEALDYQYIILAKKP